MKPLKQFKSASLGKILFYYGGYIVLSLLIHLALTSVIAYFHFQLDHEMGIVEEWLYRNGWEIMIVTKIIAVSFVFKVLTLGSYYKWSLRDFFPGLESVPHTRVFVIILFAFAFILGLGKPALSATPLSALDFQIVSYVGVSVYYLADLVLLNFLLNKYRLRGNVEKMALLIGFSSIFYTVAINLIPYEAQYHIWYFTFFSISLFFLCTRRLEPSSSIYFIFFLVAPLGSFFGMNPLWGGLYSAVVLTGHIPRMSGVIILLLSIAYLRLSLKPKTS